MMHNARTRLIWDGDISGMTVSHVRVFAYGVTPIDEHAY